MKLLLLINGSEKKIFQIHNFDKIEFEIIKVDEKDFAKPSKIIKALRKNKFHEVYFGCIENDLQRFHFFMFLYMLLSLRWTGAIIDELGNKKNFSLLKFFIILLPLFIFETILSIIIIIYYQLKIPILRWKLKIH